MTLKNYRRNKGWSQEYLAQKVNVSRLSIVRYENGSRVPDVNTAARIGEVLGIPDEELLEIFSKGA